jgi:hypothetical protein
MKPAMSQDLCAGSARLECSHLTAEETEIQPPVSISFRLEHPLEALDLGT